MPVTEINSAADLAAALKANKSKLLVVDFFATWCGPCKAIAPHVEQLSSKYAKEASFCKVDVDKVPDVAKDAGVQAMPSFGFYGDGKMVELMKGADPRGLEERVKKYSAQFFKSPFTGAGYTLSGSRPPSAAATAPSTASAAAGGAAAGSQPARKNPWADPNFMPGKKAASTSTAAAAPPAASSSTSGTNSTIPAGSKLLNPSAASSSSTPSTAASSAGTPATASTPSTSSASAAADSSVTPAPTAAASSHPALQVNPELLQQLRDMGFSDVRAQKALLFTGNKDAEDALNWLVEHQDDADIDEQLQVVGVEKKDNGGLPAGVNIDDLDEDAQVLYADMMKRRAKEQAAIKSTTSTTASSSASTAAATDNSGKKAVSDMTSEEKRQWLEDRRAAVKLKKENEALEKVKSDFKSTKGMTSALNDLKEQREEFERQQAIARRKKEDADKAKQRREIQEKIAADKERRKVEQQKTMEAIAKAKAEKAAGQ